jgi:hypothetical protein
MSRTINADHPAHVFAMQAPVYLDQAAPVTNTWYTVIDVYNARLITTAMRVLVANETLELRLTVDGEVVVLTQAAVFGTHYNASYFPYSDNINLYADASSNDPRTRSFLAEGRHIKVEVRKTTATGAGNLQASALYGTM